MNVPFAIHIYQDLIRPEWCVGGYVVAILLMVWGAWRVRDEEISRIAVLTAAFFVAAYVHVPVPGGPPAHLLLSGLLGVVLGRRSALAIPVGLFLHAVLFQHGSLSTLGANVCVMTPPALLSWLLFQGLCRTAWLQHRWFRAALVMLSAAAFVLSAVYAVGLLVANWGEAQIRDLHFANSLLLHPLTLLAALVLALTAAWLESRLDHAAEFPLGLMVGELSVLLTIFLNACFLILGGSKSWHSVVLITILAHLPLAVVEGIILGFTVGFLARVKPEMLLGYRQKRPQTASIPQPIDPSLTREPFPVKSTTLLLAVVCVLLSPGLASAHRLNADYRVLPDRRVQIQSWFPGGYPPQNATAKVLRPDGTVLAEGDLDAKGLYVFSYTLAENLHVVIRAGHDHGKEFTIPGSALTTAGKTAAPATPADEGHTPFAMTEESLPVKEFLIGVGFLLAAAAFVLSLRNARQLRLLRQALQPPATHANPEGSLTEPR